jgi:membrane protease YdiL (CAAX protease family)
MPAHDSAILAMGYSLTLLGAPILLLTTKITGRNSLAWPFRLSLWAVAGVAIGIARFTTHGDGSLGWMAPSWRTAFGAATASVGTLVAAPILNYIQDKFGKQNIFRNVTFMEIISLSIPYRLFLVVTAAVTEEIVYRGFAIGVGENILGSRALAVALSLLVFVAAHFRWGLAHMLSVLWAAIVLTTLFVVTYDLLACIAAHAALDLIGLVIAPAVMAARDRRAAHRL